MSEPTGSGGDQARLLRVVRAVYDSRLSAPQFIVLHTLHRSGADGLDAEELARRAGDGLAGISRVVNHLQRIGYLGSRQITPERRVFALTRAGREALRLLEEAFQE